LHYLLSQALGLYLLEREKQGHYGKECYETFHGFGGLGYMQFNNYIFEQQHTAYEVHYPINTW